MWIRSQNKVYLSDYTALWIDDVYVKGTINNSNYDYDILGEYGSEKRALEVLDFIQLSIASGAKILSMPKE